MNQCFFRGRLTKDPDFKYSKSGTPSCRFTIACDRKLSKAKKEEAKAKGYPTADFPQIVVYGDRAEFYAESLRKGHNVLVKCRFQTFSFDGEGGEKRYGQEHVAEDIEFLERRKAQQEGGDLS